MKRILMGMLFGLFVSLSGHVWAANLDNPVDGVFKAAYGDSVSIEIPSTVSKSPDNPASGDLTFQVDSNTTYTGFNQLADLKAGDPVQVQYGTDEKTQKMKATNISKSSSSTTTTTTSNSTSTTVPAGGSDTTTTNTETSY